MRYRKRSWFNLAICWMLGASCYADSPPSAIAEDCQRNVLEPNDRWSMSAWHSDVFIYRYLRLLKEEYIGIRDASLELKSRVGRYPVVGIGRSPGPLTAFLSILNDNPIANMAISNFRNRPASVVGLAPLPNHYLAKEPFFHALENEIVEKLFEHFENSLGQFLRSHPGPIYLADIGESGASLFAIKCYLELFVEKNGLQNEFRTILLTNPRFSRNVDEMAKFYSIRPIKIVLAENVYIDQTLSTSRWDALAEFNAFDFLHIAQTKSFYFHDRFGDQYIEVGQGQPNPRQRFLREALQINMHQDPALVSFGSSIEPQSDIPGVRWDEAAERYVDHQGRLVQVVTGDP